MLSFIYLFILTSSFVVKSVNSEGESCFTPNNFSGVCQLLPNCPSLIRLYQNDRSRNAVNFLVASQRSCGNRVVKRNPVLCCTDGVQEVTTTSIATTTTTKTTTTTTTTQRPTTTSQQLRQADCVDPNNVEGYCTSIKSCPRVLESFLARQTEPDYIEFIKESNAICNYVQPNICCPLEVTTTAPQTQRTTTAESVTTTTQSPFTPKSLLEARLLTPETGCGYSNVTHQRIVGGRSAELNGWPWICLIGYKNAFGEVTFKCGGSIITKRHILTAAHCMRTDLTSVRLGEHDTSTDQETQTIDIPVIKKIVHPAYDKRDGHSDIAILVLGDDIPFSDAIKPICLPIADPIKTRSFINYNPFVAGWGRTQEGGRAATILQELQIPILKNDDCQTRYKRINKAYSEKQFDEAIICAGNLNGGQDSCQGDSGGPLMIPQKADNKEYYYYQIGVVSYGVGCARAEVPGVYTRVANFVDWIEDQIDANS